ncbi:MAG: Secretion system C-terminal sorting domain [Flavipsychrobacter sp.]|jgi:hypothetical protein|nr:Secretion system C-terminal sorting domain [Flavipsychrobacter sp.]
MKQKLLTGLFCVLPVLAFSQTNTPSTLNAAGGTGAVAANTLDWSVGEMAAVHTASGAGIIITHGILQPADLPVSVNDLDDPGDRIKVYPNPAENQLYLETSFEYVGVMSCILYDAAGKTVMDFAYQVERGTDTRIIPVDKLAPATYFLKMIYESGGHSSGTVFTIQKQ